MDALGLYEMASKVKVNESKSQTFLFSTDHDASGSVSTSDIPFPTLGDLKAEIVHLSFLF